MRLLVIEDDVHVATVLQEGLSEAGYAVDRADSAAEAEALARALPYGLLLLDVMLPGDEDGGYRLARRLRGAGITTPILFLTARGSVDERVRGLDAGGDDYLAKPFALSELRARVRALLRRAGGAADNDLPLAAGWRLDLARREVHREGRGAPLARREFAVLEALALHPGRVFERGELVERLWAGEGDVEPKVIDVYVSALRRKLGESVVETVRGVGYRLGREER